MKIKIRGLNQHECYACSIGDIKKVFSQEDDLFIDFGFLHRNYISDSKFIKHPHIEGLIVSSIQINRRLDAVDSTPILSLYVIKDNRYNDKYKDIFCESVLPKISEWYYKTLSESDCSILGVGVLLTEWTGSDFELHICRFS